MKRKIVGLSEKVFHWNDKNTGELRHGLNVFVEGKSRDTFGLKVWQLFLDNSWSCFADLATAIDTNKHDIYIGTICDVSYNDQGYLEEIEFNPKNISSPNNK